MAIQDYVRIFSVDRADRVSITPSMVSPPSPRIPARSFGRFDEILYLVEKAPDLTLARHRRPKGVTSTATLRLLPRCGPADTSMYLRSVGPTRFCISSKRHPTSPFRTLR
jgi:hypothetical protein